MKLALKGIVPATLTPMLEDGVINLDAIDDYVSVLEKESIENVFVLGTTGEGCSLSVEERMAVAEQWVKSAKDRIRNIIVHVGACNLADTKTLAKHAESIGVTAIAALPSFYFKPATPAILARYLAEVAKSAPNTPLMFYHIPAFSGVNFKIEQLFDEIEKIGIANFCGVKFTALDLCDLGRCVDKYGQKYSIFYGFDEQCYAGLLIGCQSIVGGSYNFALKLYRRLLEACKNQDVEKMKEEQIRSQKMISYLVTSGYDVGMCKALMLPVTGIDFGPPRLPVLAPTKLKMENIISDLTNMGFFDWIK